MKATHMHVLLIALTGLAVMGTAGFAQAQAERRIGVGIGLGEPTGFYFKGWLSDANAIDGGIGIAFEGDDSLQLHGDYLWHRYEWLMPKNIRGTLPVYFGVGARLRVEDDGLGHGDRDHGDDNRFGIRLPVGINYLPYTGSYDIFAELVPVLDIAPDADFEFNAAIGARLYFP